MSSEPREGGECSWSKRAAIPIWEQCLPLGCACGTEGEQQTQAETCASVGPCSACSLHHEGVGSSIIVSDSGKELKFMACQRSELGREVKRQQNILDVFASKVNTANCVSWTPCLP